MGFTSYFCCLSPRPVLGGRGKRGEGQWRCSQGLPKEGGEDAELYRMNHATYLPSFWRTLWAASGRGTVGAHSRKAARRGSKRVLRFSLHRGQSDRPLGAVPSLEFGTKGGLGWHNSGQSLHFVIYAQSLLSPHHQNHTTVVAFRVGLSHYF